jgi:hypothetical protein
LCDRKDYVNNFVVLVLFWYWTKDGMLWIFQQEKSDGFSQERTRGLGYQRPGDPETFRFVVQCLNHCATASLGQVTQGICMLRQ